MKASYAKSEVSIASCGKEKGQVLQADLQQ